MKKHVREIRPKDLGEVKFFAKEQWAIIIPNKTSQINVEKC